VAADRAGADTVGSGEAGGSGDVGGLLRGLVALGSAQQHIQKDGLVVRNTSVKKDGTESVWFTKNPAVAIAEQAETRLRQYANDFGLTPAGERNVSKRDDDRGEHEANPFAGAVGDD
jgi:P27 family predicted phage terminase small subunit